MSHINQRQDYMERSREEAFAVFANRNVAAVVPESLRYLNMLSHAVMADFDGKVVHLPQVAAENPAVVVIAPVRHNEEVRVSPEFFAHTPTQVKSIGRTASTWLEAALLPDQLASIVSSLNATPPTEPQPIALGSTTRAMVATLTSFMNLARLSSVSKIEGMPKQGVLQVRRRPIVFMRMMPGEKFLPPAFSGHELTHVKQYVDRPLSVLTSQKTLDMAELRNELEAYHVGTIVDRMLNGVQTEEVGIQEYVSLVHEAFGIDPLDPYAPSPPLLSYMVKRLEAINATKGHLLHCAVDYATIEAGFSTPVTD